MKVFLLLYLFSFFERHSSTTFDIPLATSPNSINQLSQDYTNKWVGSHTMTTLYNLWYVTSTINSGIVQCRAYYKYDQSYYWCARVDYDTATRLYAYILGSECASGVAATSTDNGVSPTDLQQLTLYFPLQGDVDCQAAVVR